MIVIYTYPLDIAEICFGVAEIWAVTFQTRFVLFLFSGLPYFLVSDEQWSHIYLIIGYNPLSMHIFVRYLNCCLFELKRQIALIDVNSNSFTSESRITPDRTLVQIPWFQEILEEFDRSPIWQWKVNITMNKRIWKKLRELYQKKMGSESTHWLSNHSGDLGDNCQWGIELSRSLKVRCCYSFTLSAWVHFLRNDDPQFISSEIIMFSSFLPKS
jgi:hypothetical protein